MITDTLTAATEAETDPRAALIDHAAIREAEARVSELIARRQQAARDVENAVQRVHDAEAVRAATAVAGGTPLLAAMKAVREAKDELEQLQAIETDVDNAYAVYVSRTLPRARQRAHVRLSEHALGVCLEAAREADAARAALAEADAKMTHGRALFGSTQIADRWSLDLLRPFNVPNHTHFTTRWPSEDEERPIQDQMREQIRRVMSDEVEA